MFRAHVLIVRREKLYYPPDDEHMCSKHVEAWNKLLIKFSASSWLILINILRCTVSKILKLIMMFCSILVRMRYVSEASCTPNQNTHFMFNNTPPQKKNCAIYEIMWKNMVEPDRPQATIWRVSTACWITKAAYTLRIRSSYCLSTATMVTRTRLNVTLHVHCLSS